MPEPEWAEATARDEERLGVALVHPGCRHDFLSQAASSNFLDTAHVPYPMKIRFDGGSVAHVRVSAPGLTTTGSQNGVKSETSASWAIPCTTSIPLTRVPGSIATVLELLAEAPVVTTRATAAIDPTTPTRTPDISWPMVLA